MQLVTTKWLFERGGLHDARVRRIRHSGSAIEIDFDDEWANERGLGFPEGVTVPGTMIISHTGMLEGHLSDFEGGWISGIELDKNALRLAFCDRDLLVLSADSVTWEATGLR